MKKIIKLILIGLVVGATIEGIKIYNNPVKRATAKAYLKRMKSKILPE